MSRRFPILVAAVFSSASLLAQSVSSPIEIGLSKVAQGQRLGIEINIGGASKSELYLFDTGSPFFMSGYASDAPWWGTASVDSGTTQSVTYGPGSGQNRLDYHPGTASITLSGGSGSLAMPGTVKQVFEGYTNSDPNNPTPDWQPNTAFNNALVDAVTTNDPPFADSAGPFFGIYGVAPMFAGEGFFGSISQLTFDSGLSRGYVVSAAGAPSLTIGLTADRIADFTATYSMNSNGNGAYDEGILNANYRVSNGGSSLDLNGLATLLDTGTPPEAGVVIQQGNGFDVSAFTSITAGQKYLTYGTTFTMLIDGAPYTLTSTMENPIDVFDVPEGGGPGGIIYGLNFFEKYDVMYDFDTQTVGIVAVVPEPVVAYGVAGLLLVLIVIRGKRRGRARVSPPSAPRRQARRHGSPTPDSAR